MRARGVVVQGALAAAGLAAAFLVWQREPAGAPGEVVVLDASKRTLERVRYEEAGRWVELYRDTSRDGELWLRLGTQASPEPPAPRELRANETARKLFARFAPLRATRGLGALDERTLAEVGLKDSPRKLAVRLSTGEHAFSLATPVSGWGSPYLRREADGLVYLLGPSLLPDLEAAANRLVDRTLHAFQSDAYDTLTVTRGDSSRTFSVRAREARGPVEWVPQDAPDAPDEAARAWHERLWQLTPVDFLGRGEEPPGGSPQEVLRVDYRREGRTLGHLTVARGAGGEHYLRTEHTPGWARLPPWADALILESQALPQKTSPPSSRAK
jgi:hypothetical protein